MDSARFEFFQGNDTKWYWHLKAKNGEIVAVSEAYETGSGVIDGVYAAKDAFLSALSGKTFDIDRIWTDNTPTSQETNPPG